jgi:hypothetical protein
MTIGYDKVNGTETRIFQVGNDPLPSKFVFSIGNASSEDLLETVFLRIPAMMRRTLLTNRAGLTSLLRRISELWMQVIKTIMRDRKICGIWVSLIFI